MYQCYPDLSTVHSSNVGAYVLMKVRWAAIDLLQHKAISDPMQGIWDGVTSLGTSILLALSNMKYNLSRVVIYILIIYLN